MLMFPSYILTNKRLRLAMKITGQNYALNLTLMALNTMMYFVVKSTRNRICI